MKKLFAVLFVFTAVPSFAFVSGDKRMSAMGGFGFTSYKADILSGAEYGIWGGYLASDFVDAKSTEAKAYTAGIGINLFFTDSLSLYASVSYDKAPVEIKYDAKDSALNDNIYLLDFSFVNSALSLHYFGNRLIIGGGIYYDALIDKTSKVFLKEGNETTELDTKLHIND